TAMDLGRAKEALPAFRRAAEIERGPTGARLLAWATRAAGGAGEEGTAEALRREATARDPELLEGLARAARQAEQEGDEEAQAEALALLHGVPPGGVRPPSPRRLPIFEVSGPGPRPPPAASPRRPRRGAPPRSGGSPRGSAR